MLGFILLFIIFAIAALCSPFGAKNKQSSDKFMASKTKYVKTQELPDEVGVESALPPIPSQTTNTQQTPKKTSRSSKVRFSKRTTVRTFDKPTRNILNDATIETKTSDG